MTDQQEFTARQQSLRRHDRFFFGTRGLPCPYLDGRIERKVVTDLAGPDAETFYQRLSNAGFRRSHGLAYRPACRGCTACVAVRIRAEDFAPSRSQRRVLRANETLAAEGLPAHATLEQFRLFRRYQESRHGGGEMSAMCFDDYRAMIEETPLDTRVIEYRAPDGRLAAVMLSDRLADSLSAVYSFFDPVLEPQSPGSYMILAMIADARRDALPFVYLGYWIAASRKMAYKARYRPIEGLGENGWVPLDEI